jgi:hypothetical protein
MADMLRVLSLGAGVQSSTVAMMMEHGELPRADLAIFADTGAEPRRVYEWLDWLRQHLTMPVHVVQQGRGLTANLEEGCQGKAHCSNPPFFVGGAGLLRRNCTRDYKIAPINRELHRVRNGRKVVQVFGISFDERQRMRTPNRQYLAAYEYPLVDRQMTRRDCLQWMSDHGYPLPPRSACVYCPYRCDVEWRRLRDTDPEGWAEACRVDALVRTALPGVRAQRGHQQTQCYVHRSCVPLPEVDLSTDVDRGQMLLPGLGWADCEGMCGI